MIPVRLSLEGFLSYLEKTTIELSSVEVACISGPNGAGKSSLFDAITWSLFGRARRNDDALINDGADACTVTFEFLYEGALYRVMRQKTRDKSALLELHIQTDDLTWKVLTEAGLRATETRIRDILRMDYDTFINASFFLQGKADVFTQQNPSRRKDILSSILGLDAWETYKEEAAARRRDINNQVKVIRLSLDEIQDELAQEAQRREQLESFQKRLEASELLRQAKEGQLSAAQRARQELQHESEKLSAMQTQIEAIKNQLLNTVELINARTGELETGRELLLQSDHVEEAYRQWRLFQNELEDLNNLSNTYHGLHLQKSALEGEIHSEEARLQQDRQALLKTQEEVIRYEAELPRIRAELGALISENEAYEKNMALLPQLEQDLQAQQNTRAQLQAENSQLKNQMNEIKQHIQDLEGALGSECPLCGQALSDDHRKVMLASLQQEGTSLGNRYRENADHIAELDGEVNGMTAHLSDLRSQTNQAGARQQKIGSLTNQVADYETRLEKWNSSDKLNLSQIEQALDNQTFALAARQEIDKLNKTIQDLGYDAQRHEEVRNQENSLREYEQKHQLLQTARATQEILTRELNTLRNNKAKFEEDLNVQTQSYDDVHLQIKAKQEDMPDLAGLESELTSLRLEENRLRQETGGAQQAVQVLESLRQRQAEYSEQIEDLNQQVSHLKILEAAFSKDGVPALLIEQALPEIESQANMVLDRLSDGRMSVNFETEREYKDKRREDKKQTLDIIISDSVGRREYEMFSGGESFRINFAIRLALSRVLAGRAGARLQTLVIDEGFGSQDADGRQRLVEAINLVKPDFEKILVITHMDELKDAFPSRIEVQKTEHGSVVEVIA